MSYKNRLTEKQKSDLKIHYLMKKTRCHEPSFSSLLNKKHLKLSLNIWVMWFVVSYIFYGCLYLIPEIVGKDKNNLNYNDLVMAVIYSTIFELIGIIFTFVMEIKYIGRIGAFKISFIFSFILSLLCILNPIHINIYLQMQKGAIQIANRALFTYTTECYPTEIRGIALGLANVFTRIAGICTPITNELFLAISQHIVFLFLGLSALIGLICSFLLKIETLNIQLDS